VRADNLQAHVSLEQDELSDAFVSELHSLGRTC
jgi:hypothetical protein